MRKELDQSYRAKSGRIFGCIFGTLSAWGFSDDSIDSIKGVLRPSLDEQYGEPGYSFEEAQDAFLDVLADSMECIGASSAQINAMEIKVRDSLSFDFDESRGNQ